MTENLISKDNEINPLLQKLRKTPIAGNGDTSTFESFDGTKIFYRTWTPTKKIEKIVIVAHGMGGHGEFFVLLADKIIEHGIMVIALDYRNHGRSEGKKGDLIRFKDILRDYNEFVASIKEKQSTIPIFLLGESMGGAVCINFSREFPQTFSNLNGTILFAPAVKINVPKIFWVGIFFVSSIILFLRLITPSKGIISAKGREGQGIKNLTHQQYDKTDPLHLTKMSIRYLLQIFKHVRKAKKIAPKISIPILIFQGDSDKGISPAGVRDFYNKLDSKDKTFVNVEGGYHALLTDECFQDKWPILIDWIKNH